MKRGPEPEPEGRKAARAFLAEPVDLEAEEEGAAAPAPDPVRRVGSQSRQGRARRAPAGPGRVELRSLHLPARGRPGRLPHLRRLRGAAPRPLAVRAAGPEGASTVQVGGGDPEVSGEVFEPELPDDASCRIPLIFA